MEITIGKFKVRPYHNGLCWEIWELRKAKAKNGEEPASAETWQFTGKYPSTLESALLTVYELSLKKSSASGDLKSAMREARQICEEIKRAVGKVGAK